MGNQITLAQKATWVAKAIIDNTGPFASTWPHRHQCIEPAPGTRLVVAVDDALAIREVPARDLAHKIVAWLRDNGEADMFLTVKQAMEVVDYWLAVSKPIPLDDVKSTRWQDEPGYAWGRLPWGCPTPGPTPTWDILLSRCSNRKALMAWIGSLFYEQSDIQQYVWCFGRGNNGKGSLNRFLERVFGRVYASKQPPGGNKHWTYGLLGKRIVVFPDCNDASFVTQGLFKSMTGGDPIDVDPKYRDPYTVKLRAKYLFLSNERPNLSSETADGRRIIYCEFEDRDGEKNDPKFEGKLWGEGGQFLSACMIAYMEAAPEHQQIETDQKAIRDWIETVEDEFAEALDYHFSLHDLKEQLDWIRPVVFQRHVEISFKQRRKQLEFIAWLERKHGVKKVTAHDLAGEPKVYRGLVAKSLQLVAKKS